MVHGLEADYAGQAEFVYLDVDDPETAELKETLGYQGQPHIFVLDPQGNVVGDWQGRVEAETLQAALDQAGAVE